MWCRGGCEERLAYRFVWLATELSPTAWHTSATSAPLQPAESYPGAASTMASKLTPFLYRRGPLALRQLQRTQWRSFSVTAPARSDALFVVRSPSLPFNSNCAADKTCSTVTRLITIRKFRSSLPRRMRSSSRRSSPGTPRSTRRPR